MGAGVGASGTEATPADPADLCARVAALEQAIAALVDRLDDEVRTRRLVVVDDAGADRAVIEVRHGTASVLVRSAGSQGADVPRGATVPTSGIELYAQPLEHGEPTEVGWCLLRDGDVVARWIGG